MSNNNIVRFVCNVIDWRRSVCVSRFSCSIQHVVFREISVGWSWCWSSCWLVIYKQHEKTSR